MTGLAAVSPQWDCALLTVSHAACFRAPRIWSLLLARHDPAMPQRVCDTFGATTAVRVPVARPRSIAGVDTRTKEGKRG